MIGQLAPNYVFSGVDAKESTPINIHFIGFRRSIKNMLFFILHWLPVGYMDFLRIAMYLMSSEYILLLFFMNLEHFRYSVKKISYFIMELQAR